MMKDQPMVINDAKYLFNHAKFRAVIEERKTTLHQSQAAVLRDIAEHCHTNATTIKNWLYTNSSPDLALITSIAEYLDVPLLDVLTEVLDEGEENRIDISAEVSRLRVRMKNSILSFRGLYEYLACIRGFDISRWTLFWIIRGKRIPSVELYKEIDFALSSAEQVRNERLFPLSIEKGDENETV